MNLFELFVKIGAKDEASGTISKITSGLGKGLATAAKVGTAAVTAVTAAAGAMSAAFIKGTSEVAQYGDNIDKMSQKMGLSAEAYQEWDFIMQHSGTSIESLQASMKTLANAVDSGNDAFNRLGISQKEISEMNQEELFAKTIEQLQKVEDTTERTYLAGQLLGRGATELGALLNTSAEDTEAMRKQVHELGGVMSNEAVKAAAAYQDSLQNMQTAFSGIQRGMLSEFLPSMVTVMDGLSLIFSGNDSGVAKITEGVNKFADKLMETVPKIFELGEGILSSLATAILDNLPTLTSTATSVIINLVDGIVSALPVLAESAIEIIGSLTQGLSDNLPTIIESAVELISTLADGILDMLPQIVQLGLDLIISLANGIAESLPELIPTIIDVVFQIVEILTSPDTLNSLIGAALEIMLALAEGIINSIPVLVGAIPQLITSLIDGLLSSIPQIIQAGISLLTALVAALPDIITAIVEAIPEIIDGIITALTENIPLIIQAGIDLLVALIDALPEIIVAIVQAIPQIISGIVDALIGNIDEIIMAGVELFVALIENLPTIIVEIVKAVPQIIEGIVEAFSSLGGELVDAGSDLLHGLWEGISSAASWLWEKVSGWASSLVSDIKNLFGIHSPSTVFASIGGYMAEGLGEGWDDKINDVRDEINDSLDFDDPSISINASVNKIGSEASGISGMSYGQNSIGNSTINIVINGAQYSDEDALAEAISYKLQEMMERRARA